MSEIPVFVINLPRDKERRFFVETQLKKLNILYEIVNGISGSDERVVQSYDEELAKKEQGKPLTNGEKGCAFSHRLLYERIIREEISCVLILEDDVILPPYFKTIIETEGSKKYKSWDWLALDYQPVGLIFIKNWMKVAYGMLKKRQITFFFMLLKFPYIVTLQMYEGLREGIAVKTGYLSGPRLFLRPMYRTGAYMITLEGAKKMFHSTHPLRLSADRAPNQARIKNGLVYRGYVPVPVDQEQTFTSNTQI